MAVRHRTTGPHYRVWYNARTQLWCVSPDHKDGKTRRPAFIMNMSLDRAMNVLAARIAKHRKRTFESPAKTWFGVRGAH